MKKTSFIIVISLMCFSCLTPSLTLNSIRQTFPNLKDKVFLPSDYPRPKWQPVEEWTDSNNYIITVGTKLRLEIHANSKINQYEQEVNPGGVVILFEYPIDVNQQPLGIVKERIYRLLDQEKENLGLEGPFQITLYASRKTYYPVAVIGYVKSPRAVAYREGFSLSYAIASAGWFREGACVDQILIIKHSPSTRLPEAVVVCDFSQDPNAEITPYDIVIIPGQKKTQGLVSEWELVDSYFQQKISRDTLISSLSPQQD